MFPRFRSFERDTRHKIHVKRYTCPSPPFPLSACIRTRKLRLGADYNIRRWSVLARARLQLFDKQLGFPLTVIYHRLCTCVPPRYHACAVGRAFASCIVSPKETVTSLYHVLSCKTFERAVFFCLALIGQRRHGIISISRVPSAIYFLARSTQELYSWDLFFFFFFRIYGQFFSETKTAGDTIPFFTREIFNIRHFKYTFAII